MGSFEQDSNPDHNWDDSWEIIWNEFDWEKYLGREEDEVNKYQSFYDKLIKSSNRLDEVALYMGSGVHATEPLLKPSAATHDYPLDMQTPSLR